MIGEHGCPQIRRQETVFFTINPTPPVNSLEELHKLTALFPEAESLFLQAEAVPTEKVPEPYKRMLAHDHHMTVTMEEYHQTLVDVEVLAKRTDGGFYSRKILFKKTGTDDRVQFGIVRLRLDTLAPDVRDEILSERIPLGRALIQHNVMRHIELGTVVRFVAGPALARQLKMEVGQTTYGRLATIFCDQRPAIDLLEISSPITQNS